MSAPSRPPSGCSLVQSAVAEVALGIVSGSERAEALRHLGDCGDCRRMVDDLAQVADSLLLLTPTAEPRIGFEARVLTGMGEGPSEPRVAGARRRSLRDRSIAPVLASVTVALLMVAAGAAVGVAFSASGPTTRTAVAVTSGGDATCRAFVYGGDSTWLFVDLEAPPAWDQAYAVELVVEGDAGVRPVGELLLDQGHGTLGTRLEVPAKEIEAIRMLDARGVLRYEARFS